jgi:alpha-mannosidase/mannosylglycerate hydrolase
MAQTDKELNFYLHTHWDREWYLPFETFRTQLVTVVRRVLDLIESGAIPNFLLDGQSLALEDAAEIDPTLKARLAKQMEGGKLGAGPWMVLADQMLVGGESLIRNLKIGMSACKQFGPPVPVGYCPDTFGHSQDLPRILNGFGIKNAFVWRGVPGGLNNTVFEWQSPDGSHVNAYHLCFGYYQTMFHGEVDIAKLAERLELWANLEGPKLVPVGGDHLLPPAGFSKAIKDVEKQLTTRGIKLNFLTPPLSEFAASIEKFADLPKVKGELRDNAFASQFERAYMLQGVLSSRLYLKRANRIQEHRLASIIEPLLTLISLRGSLPYPNWELEHAWKLLIANHPHDSICGCSVDQVHDEMVIRTNRFHQALDAVEKKAAQAVYKGVGKNEIARFSRALNMVADPKLSPTRLLAYNLSQDEVSAPVRFQWAEEVLSPETEKAEAASASMQIRSSPALAVAGLTAAKDSGPLMLGKNSVALSETLQIVSMREESQVFTAVGEEPVEKRIKLYDGWVWIDKLPPFSMQTSDWGAIGDGGNGKSGKSSAAPVILEPRGVSNGLLRLEITDAGSLVVEATPPTGSPIRYELGHSFRDVADAGDTYNHDPIVADVPVISRVLTVSQRQRGPLVGSLSVTYELEIPLRVIEMESEDAIPFEKPGVPERAVKYVRSVELIKHEVTTEILLKKGIPIVFFETKWNNRAEDHRLEVVFSTSKKVEKTLSENHFSVVKRKHTGSPEALPVAAGHEAALDRFPCQRFFLAEKQAFFNQGLPEYGTHDKSVSITVLRAVSKLSRPRLRTRGGGAGPSLATPGANSLGENIVNYGWAPLGVFSETKATDHDQLSEAYALADQYEGMTWLLLTGSDSENAVVGESKDSRDSTEATSPFLRLDNNAVRVRSMHMDQSGKSVFVRLLNVTNEPQALNCSVAASVKAGSLTRLDGMDILKMEFIDKSERKEAQITLSQNELTTLKLDL